MSRCSKSRAALALLTERGARSAARAYLDDPLSLADLEELGKRLARPIAEWVRRGEASYAEAGLSTDSGDAELLQAMSEHPSLIERPILIRGARAVVGRPTENLLELL